MPREKETSAERRARRKRQKIAKLGHDWTAQPQPPSDTEGSDT